MEETVKNWIEEVYMREKQYGHGQSASYSMTQCFAVVTFAIDCLNCNEDLFKWWSREMLPKFKELQHYQYELRHAPSYVNTTGVGAT